MNNDALEILLNMSRTNNRVCVQILSIKIVIIIVYVRKSNKLRRKLVYGYLKIFQAYTVVI